MALSADSLYVVGCVIPYSGWSGDTENLYQSLEEAQAACEKSNSYFKSMNSTLRHEVITLSEHIDIVRSESQD